MSMHLTLNSNRSRSMVAPRGSAGPRRYARRMSASDLRRMLRAGDLVATTIPPGSSWLPVLRRARQVGAAVLPIDVRLSSAEATRAHRHGATDRAHRRGRHAPRRRDDHRPCDRPGHRHLGDVRVTRASQNSPPRLSRRRCSPRPTPSTPDRGDRWLSCLPLAHIGGLLVVERHLLIGAPLTFRRRLTRSVVARLRDARFTSTRPDTADPSARRRSGPGSLPRDPGRRVGHWSAIWRRVPLVPARASCRPTG